MGGAQTLLTAVVGSKLHGLDTPESDTDLAHVVISPLVDIVSPFRDDSNKHNQGDQKDEVRYELRHFCKLAVQGNPTVLEVLWSNQVKVENDYALWLRQQKHRVLSAKRVYDAHRGYALSQRKRSEGTCPSDVKRMGKAAAAYMRVLLQGTNLLLHGEINPNVREAHPLCADLMMGWKKGATYEATFGKYDSLFKGFEKHLDWAYENTVLPAQADIEWIEHFLLEAYMCHQDGYTFTRP